MRHGTAGNVDPLRFGAGWGGRAAAPGDLEHVAYWTADAVDCQQSAISGRYARRRDSRGVARLPGCPAGISILVTPEEARGDPRDRRSQHPPKEEQ
jgi:hypothetical protein